MTQERKSFEEFELTVLRWVEQECWDVELSLDLSEAPSTELPDLSGLEVDEALSRLSTFGSGSLIAGERNEGSGAVWWFKLRPTADGLRVLGSWPPPPTGSLDRALAGVLAELAGQTDDVEEQKAFRRSAGAVGRFAGGVIGDIAKTAARGAGGDLA